MNAYLDASALVKLYVEEPGSNEAQQAVDGAGMLLTSSLAFVEVHSALARRLRSRDLRPPAYEKVRAAFVADWRQFVAPEPGAVTLERAAVLVQTHALKALDAIHLATALELLDQAAQEAALGDGDDRDVRAEYIFVCADQRLAGAARSEGLNLLPLPR